MRRFSIGNTKGIASLILSLIITAAYLPTFSGEFILDDRPLVKDNIFIREFDSPFAYLSHEDGVGIEGPHSYHTGYYRPLISLFYAIDYRMWGMKALGFRVTNLVLHLLTCVILYQCIVTLQGGRFSALVVALLFGLHPANTESVAWISSRNNILVTLFSLISTITYVMNRREERLWARLVSYVSFMAALLCKEFAIMLLPILFFYNRLVVRERMAMREEILGYVPYLAMLLFYFVLRAETIGSVVTPLSGSNVWKRIYFTPYLILYNLKLILFPYGLHNFIVHYPDSFLDWRALSGFAVLMILGALLWKERKNKIVLFSVFSFLVALFPVLNIIHTSAVSVVSMRWLYFPMVFLCFSCVFYLQRMQSLNRLYLVSGLGAIVIYFGTYSYLLNENLWHDEDVFFSQEVQHFKNYFYAGGLAESLYNRSDLGEAERYFLMAIDRYPNKAENYINYSALLIETGRVDGALSYLDKVKSASMSHCERGKWFNNRGMIYFIDKEYHSALTYFSRAVSICPNVAQFWANLGGGYGSIGDYRKSVSVLNEGLARFPNSNLLRKNLSVSYCRLGEYAMAISVLERIPPHARKEDPEISVLLKEAHKMKKTHDHL
jgi:tetratricopeptide (TPR) repeat protein